MVARPRKSSDRHVAVPNYLLKDATPIFAGCKSTSYDNRQLGCDIQDIVGETHEKLLPVTSSVPPDLPEEQQQLFRELIGLCNRENVRYAVSGAFALQQHTGIWRYTKDLDLFMTAASLPRALKLLEQAQYVCEICDPVWLAKARREEFFVDLITGMSNGVIVVDDSWIERAAPALILGVPSRVLAAEELIASKLFVTRRERFDGADIAHVIFGSKGALDWQRILYIAGEHWEMVLWALVLFHYVYPAHSSYVPRELWGDLLGRLQKSLQHPDTSASFRGSLIDEKMFAIDVNEWGMEDVLQQYRDQRLIANGVPAEIRRKIA